MKALGVLALCLVFVTSCDFFSSDKVVVQIHQKQWKRSEFARLLALKAKNFPRQSFHEPGFLKKLKDQLIQDLLFEEVIYQWAKKHHLSVQEGEVSQALKEFRVSYPSDKVFKAHLRKNHLSEQRLKKHIHFRLLNQKVLKHLYKDIPPPSLKEMKHYYQSHRDRFVSDGKVKMRQILHSDRGLLLKIRSQIQAGGHFERLARRFSQAPDPGGGRWVQKEFMQMFKEKVSLKPGQITQVLSSPYGYHLMEILKIRPGGALSFNQALPALRSLLLKNKKKAFFSNWLDKQSKKFHVLTHSEMLKQIRIKVL